MTVAAAEEMTSSSSPMTATEDEFLLKWHDHHQSFFLLVEELVVREQLTDVTLACGGEGQSYQLLPAHSLMLSVCSPYFRTLLSENRHKEKHHIIHLHGVSARHMQQLLWYMYRGELSICQDDLAPLIETARCLQIKGLAMAATPPPPSNPPSLTPSSLSPSSSMKKRPFSQISNFEATHNSAPKTQRKTFPKQSVIRALCVPSPPEQKNTEEDEIGHDYESLEHNDSAYYKMGYGMPPPGGTISPMGVSLPLLPKPLADLKTAETRTYLSKLVWLGNGGRRPQYGNPETKPCWWPQHILPWEDMKKMGGRKSAELTHINYTEVLKQCLAAGYEYFGYDPSTYFSTEPPEDLSFAIMEDHSQTPLMEETELEDCRQEGVLEIDLDKVDSCGSSRVTGGSEQQSQILCQ